VKDYKDTSPPRVKRMGIYGWAALIVAVLFILILALMGKFRAAPDTAAAIELSIPTTVVVSSPTPSSSASLPAIRASEAPSIIAPTLTSSLSSPEWEHITISRGDNLAKIFSRLKFSPQDVHKVVTASKDAMILKKLLPGRQLGVLRDEQGRLQAVRYHVKPTEILHIWTEEDTSWKSEIVRPLVDTKINFASAVIEDSLFLAGKRAGLEDPLVMTLADIYSWDIDFLQDIRPGDRFQVLYEEQYIDGERVDVGPILAASFETRGKVLDVYRFTDAHEKTGYYTADGQSVRKAFLRTPVKFTRISSKFDLNRKHPVLHKIRAHKGVDYAAPSGTPIKATGDGKIIFCGEHGGFGNVIKIQHGSRYTTVYAHLKSFARGVKQGKAVKQGQIIGYVGMTGLATGPHLHYEFQVDGQHKNPLTVALPMARAIDDNTLPLFKTHITQMTSLFEKHSDINVVAKGES
jgi:murein DD-endopeptidase MepM/ murein hydrolase activator NlpD